MKQALIVALVCLNAALLVALVFGTGVPTAQAQVVGGGSNYLLMTGRIGGDYDGVFLLDLKTRQVAAIRLDKNRKRMVPIAKRELKRDFGRKD